MTLQVRSYEPCDAKALAEIYYNTIHNVNTRDYSTAQVNAWAPASSLEIDGWQKKWAKLPPLVAVLGDQIVGFAEFEPTGHIDCFYVHHEYQSIGAGSALMNEIEKVARQKSISRIYAEVSITAKPFFEKKGFLVVKQQTVTIRGVELTNFLMEKHLNGVQMQVERVTSVNQEEMISYLHQHDDYTLFLLFNYENYGAGLSDSPFSGNFKVIRSSGSVVAVFSLTKKGHLLIQSDVTEPVFDLVLESCLEEKIPLTGLIGDFRFCEPFWNYLKEKKRIQSETFASKEVLYRADLDESMFTHSPGVRLLRPEDYNSWRPLRLDYIKEVGLPNNLSDSEMYANYQEKCEGKIIWGYFVEDRLVSIADLNARTSNSGQLGGVYTHPDYRKKGYSKAVVQTVMSDIRKLHNIRKLIIFTGEDNIPAKKLYESLGVCQVGYFSLYFGNE